MLKLRRIRLSHNDTDLTTNSSNNFHPQNHSFLCNVEDFSLLHLLLHHNHRAHIIKARCDKCKLLCLFPSMAHHVDRDERNIQKLPCIGRLRVDILSMHFDTEH
ncbi:unnamed protein product [Clavelina lepadiformis]|uniref:Uncharacterized protein n=1 Tax=Clavelina lepadiformis TaxID=159417 RepID=A0ABP0F098_CLALP